jgi:hypothetical protein
MSDIIDFLVQLGQDAQLRHATRDELERALANTGISAAIRAAIFAGEQRQLETLVGAQSNICCMVAKPGFDDEEEEKIGKVKDPDDEDVEESPWKRVAVSV